MTAEQELKVLSRKLIWTIAAIAALDFLIIVAGGVILMTLLPDISSEGMALMVMPLVVASFVPIMYLIARISRLKTQFWKEVAAHFGFGYEHHPWFKEEALVFREGHSKRTGHGIIGTVENHPFRLFEYAYAVGHGKGRRDYFYIVIEITFGGSFPHLYMNYLRNRGLSGLKSLTLPRVTLPLEFEKSFKLHAPGGYEMEALHVFTPDVLAHLLNSGWQHDFELVDGRLYIFREEAIDERSDLERELAQLKAFMGYLAPKLARMKLAPIGDLKTTL